VPVRLSLPERARIRSHPREGEPQLFWSNNYHINIGRHAITTENEAECGGPEVWSSTITVENCYFEKMCQAAIDTPETGLGPRFIRNNVYYDCYYEVELSAGRNGVSMIGNDMLRGEDEYTAGGFGYMTYGPNETGIPASYNGIWPMVVQFHGNFIGHNSSAGTEWGWCNLCATYNVILSPHTPYYAHFYFIDAKNTSTQGTIYLAHNICASHGSKSLSAYRSAPGVYTGTGYTDVKNLVLPDGAITLPSQGSVLFVYAYNQLELLEP